MQSSSARPCSESRIASWAVEPSIGEMLADPVVQALMAADGVNANMLGAQLTAIARQLSTAD